jgi:hypothetical protein
MVSFNSTDAEATRLLNSLAPSQYLLQELWLKKRSPQPSRQMKPEQTYGLNPAKNPIQKS